MNDTLREFTSYGGFLLPLLKVRREIQPRAVRWGGRDQYFLHYAPPVPSRTLVIYIHGGGWNSGTPSAFHFIGQRFALEGFHCILPGYRKTPRYHFQEILGDIFRGYREISGYLAEQELTFDRVFLVGSSAGAHLGALLCYDRARQRQYGVAPALDGLVCLAGPLCFDFPQTRAQNYLMTRLFASGDPSVWKKGEPLSVLESGQTTPALVVQSRHDGLIGWEQAETFCVRAARLGIPVELYEVSEKWDTHSAYSAGIFLRTREESPALCKVLDWICFQRPAAAR